MLKHIMESLTEKSIWEVYFKYSLSILHLYFRSLKSNRSMLYVNFLKTSINEIQKQNEIKITLFILQ